MKTKYNIISYDDAVENGLEPKEYLLDIKHLFNGKEVIELLVILDFKIYTLQKNALGCYFFENKTKTKFKIFVYDRTKFLIDFTTCPTSKTYRIEIKLVNNMPKLLSCEISD
jgi:hypothetical protein